MNWLRVDLSAEEFNRRTEPPITCGLIYRGKRHAMSGPPEAAKTLAALIFGLEWYRAGHGPFALIDFEMGEHATRLLLHELGATLAELAAVYYVPAEGPPDAADLDAIETAGVTLVIIDAAAGAYDVSGLDDMKRADAEKFARAWVTPLWKRGIATILIDHVVKKTNARGKFAIGTERKLGAIDVHLGLEAIKQLHRGADGLITFTTHKDRPAHLSRPRATELELRSDPDTHAITWTFREAGTASTNEGGFRPTTLMEKVSRYLERQTEPIFRSKIAKPDAVSGKREWVLVAVDCLVTEEYANAKTDLSGTLISHIRPFRVPDAFPSENLSDVPDVPRVPTAFPRVPDDADATDVPAFPLPTGRDANGNVNEEPQKGAAA